MLGDTSCYVTAMNSSPFTRGPNKGRGIPQDWRRGSHQYRDGGVRGDALGGYCFI